jgi:hypothetical protein
MRKAATAAVTAACFFVVTSFAALAASAFEGVWKVKDTAGHPFEITLSSDGAAKATRGEGMTGTWKEEGNSAVITWNTGWTTKITKEGDRYIKAASLPGHMRIEVEPGIAVSAKTVGELRKATSWPENLVITTPQERHSEITVKVSKASIATHYPPRR